MSNAIHCPECGVEFELTDVMRAELESDVKKQVESEVRVRLKDKDAELEKARNALALAASSEAALRKEQRELEDAKRAVERDVERRLADELKKIRKAEGDAAREKYAREAEEVVRAKQNELAEAQAKLAKAAANEAAILKKQRELEERERQASVEIEQRLADEAKKIRGEAQKAAEAKYAREAEEKVRAAAQELAETRTKLAEAAKQQAAVARKERELEERAQKLTIDTEARIADEAKKVRAEAQKAAEAKFAREAEEKVRLKDQELADVQTKLGEATKAQATLLKKEREVEERARQLEVEVEKKIAEEARRAHEAAAKTADEKVATVLEQQKLVDEQHRLQIEGMQKMISDLKRRAEQGSQQLQGEAQEVVLRDLLVSTFDDDDIEDVAHGARGADALQKVRGATAGGGASLDCGSILWESKRTKAWSDEWLAKARDDQRAAGAAIAIIVTQAMPADIKGFGLKDGVWVCAWPHATALGAAMRAGLVEVALARRASEGRGEKMQMLYDYLTGNEFRNRVGGFVDAFKEMQEQLDKEKRAMLVSWQRREKLMSRAQQNVAAFYGDLQGIAGRQLRDLPTLALEEPSTDALPELAESDEKLEEIFFGLLPADGTNTGNGSLFDAFREQAVTELGVIVTEDDYVRCKDVLLAKGRIRRGKGKGGSVSRG